MEFHDFLINAKNSFYSYRRAKIKKGLKTEFPEKTVLKAMVKKIIRNSKDQSLNISDALRLAIKHHQKGQLLQAEAIYHKVLSMDKNNADALHLLGVIALRAGKNQEAICLIEKAIDANQLAPFFHNNAGDAYRALNKLDEAIASYRRALFLNPEFHEAYNNLGNALERQGKPDEAIACYRRALSLKPDYHEAHNNLGVALEKQGRLDEAIACYRSALSLKPEFLEAYNNLGSALEKQGKLDEAIACYRRALSLKPDCSEAHFNLSVIYLLKGNFKEGWEEYQYRVRKWDTSRYFNRDFTQKYWDGSDIKSKTILLWTEQGYGDAIQFIRYIPMVSEKTDKIIVECQTELVSLMQRINGIHQVVERGQQLPDFDFHCPLLTLPLIFNTTLETIPATIPYITSDRQKVSAWRERLQHDCNKLKVGLCWAGSPGHGNDRNRSISPGMFSLFGEMEDVAFYSLQKGAAEGQAGDPPKGMRLVDYTNDLNDFSDTAALIENLDLVITVDTAVAHLAGALAKPVWLLLPFVPDWRWLLDRGDSPWYPTMRLYRQPEYGDWESVLKMLKQELRSIL